VYAAAGVTGATIVLVAAGEDLTVIQARATHKRHILGCAHPVRTQDVRATRQTSQIHLSPTVLGRDTVKNLAG